jgi:predicted nucleic acid-binding protein
MSGNERAFFDTTVLVYLLSEDLKKAERAEMLLAGRGIMSVQVLNEFTAVASRKRRMKLPEIREMTNTFRALCQVEPITVETHDLGLAIGERFGFSIYDALIVASAQIAQCEILYSEDFQNGLTIEKLVILNPFWT